MGDKSAIQWTEATWNVVTGCTKVSPGCARCYIERSPPFRIAGRKFVNGTIPLAFHPDRLDLPLRWKRPRMIFVNSLSDLFHEDVPDAFIDRVFGVMALADWHTFQVLTKRPSRARSYLLDLSNHYVRLGDAMASIVARAYPGHGNDTLDRMRGSRGALATWGGGFFNELKTRWPLPNVWLGATVENRRWRSRLDDLRATQAAVRFVSFEPLLEDVSDGLDLSGIHWAIWGGESGPGARHCALEWLERGVEVSRRFGTKPFVKQLGAYVVSEERTAPLDCFALSPPPRAQNGEYYAWRQGTRDRKGGDIAEFPETLRVRELPI